MKPLDLFLPGHMSPEKFLFFTLYLTGRYDTDFFIDLFVLFHEDFFTVLNVFEKKKFTMPSVRTFRRIMKKVNQFEEVSKEIKNSGNPDISSDTLEDVRQTLDYLKKGTEIIDEEFPLEI